MSTVSVREFSYNPSAMFAQAEEGETIEITRHGKVIAMLIAGYAMHLATEDVLSFVTYDR